MTEQQIIGGNFRIISALGSGGFGLTFLAENLRLPGRPRCVVKKLHTKFPDEKSFQVARRLFHQEAETLYHLGGHPKIPALIAHFEEKGEFFLVQELVEGETLAQNFGAHGNYSEKEAVELITQILETLTFVHSRNVIHRDIKPTNLIRRQSDRNIFLIDFGAVKQVSINAHNQAPTFRSTITIGSTGYMPPEQTAGKPRFASDLYAAGLVTIEALTGLNPLKLPQNQTTGEFVWQHKTRINADFGNFLSKLVRYDFRQRYTSANEAFAALQMLASIAGYKRKPLMPQAPNRHVFYPPSSLPNSSQAQVSQITISPTVQVMANQRQTLFQPNPLKLTPVLSAENSAKTSASNNDFKLAAGIIGGIFALFLISGFMIYAAANYRTQKEVLDVTAVKKDSSKPSPAFQEALNQAGEAEIVEKKATTKFEWDEVSSKYKRAAQLMDSVKPDSTEYEKSRTKSAEFRQKSSDASRKADEILYAAQNSPNSQPKTTINPSYSSYYSQQTSTPAATPIKKAKMPGRQKNKMYIAFSSSTGDYIGQGKETVITDEYGNFSMRLNSKNQIYIHYRGSTFWSLNLAAPQESRLSAGTYNGAQRSAANSRPGLDFSGDGRGCNQLKGNFTINNIVFSADETEVLVLDATFVQYCEGGSASLMGRVYIDARY